MQIAAVWLSFAGATPLIATGLLGTNHNLRHVMPSVIVAAPGLAILFARIQAARTRPTLILRSAFLFLLQLIMILVPAVHPMSLQHNYRAVSGRAPWEIMRHWEQWDWNQLREVALANGIRRKASISYLGNGSTFNPEQIRYPWIAHNEEAPKVRWLWRYEEGEADLKKIMGSLEETDIVLTSPGYRGMGGDKQDLDNRYNSEFARRLEDDTRFKGPIRIHMGRLQPVDVTVFVRVQKLRAAAGELDAPFCGKE